MNTDQMVDLINLLSKKRAESGLSVAELARRANVDVAAVWRLEQGMIAKPTPETLLAVGGVLGIPSIDLFAIVGWLPSHELPTLVPYLKAKYGPLPSEATQEIEACFATVARKFHLNGWGNQERSARGPAQPKES